MLVLVWVVQALQQVDLVTDGGAALASFLWIALLIVPRVFTIVVPFALVIAVVNALNAMNDDSETVVVSAAGAGRRTFVVPVMALALLVGLVNLAAVHLVEPASRQAFRAAISDARADAHLHPAARGPVPRPGRRPDRSHRRARAPGGAMTGLLLSDRRDEGAERTYYAATATLAEREGIEYIVMRDGEVHSRSLSDGTIDVVGFTAYALDLSNLSENAEGGAAALRQGPLDGRPHRPRPRGLGVARRPRPPSPPSCTSASPPGSTPPPSRWWRCTPPRGPARRARRRSRPWPSCC